jgi:hypothetical protein
MSSLLGDDLVLDKGADAEKAEDRSSDVKKSETSVEDGYFDALGFPNDYVTDNKILGKYKTPKELADGYKEQSRLLREKTPTAPEDGYKFDFSKHETLKVVESVADDPLWKAFEPKFKELGITQQQAEGLMESHLLWTLENIPNMESEEKRLGSEAKAIIETVSAFAKKHVKTQEDIDAFEYVGRNADAIKLVHRLIGMTGERPIPSPNGSNIYSTNSLDGLNEQASLLRNNPRFNVDSDMQKKYMGLMTKITELTA